MGAKRKAKDASPLRGHLQERGLSKGTRRYLRAVADADAAMEKGPIATSFQKITPYKNAEFVSGGAPGTGKKH